MLPEQERPDVGYGALLGIGGMALCRESMCVCVCVSDVEMETLSSDRPGGGLRLSSVSSCHNIIAK